MDGSALLAALRRVVGEPSRGGGARSLGEDAMSAGAFAFIEGGYGWSEAVEWNAPDALVEAVVDVVADGAPKLAIGIISIVVVRVRRYDHSHIRVGGGGGAIVEQAFAKATKRASSFGLCEKEWRKDANMRDVGACDDIIDTSEEARVA